MYVKQIYTGCLSESAYFIESDGEAAVIDPLRDTDAYLELAKERNVTIKYIFETHFHADFVSGHLDLSKKTNAPIIYGPEASTNFPSYNAKDGEEFQIGNIVLQAIHTPGHTLESTCYLLFNVNKNPYCIFTGDTLFVGDVGRPDLSSGNMSKEELAAVMYDTLQNKILPLSDNILVYPAHGPGSSCGKNLGPDIFSTIGEQKKNNYALKTKSKEQFIKDVTDGLGEAPIYFSVNAQINKQGYDDLALLKEKGLRPLSIKDVKKRIKEDIILLDTRNAAQFTSGFIPSSIFIGLEGRFAEWAGALLPFDRSIILITENGKEEETLIRLARVGFDKVEGYLKGGFDAWQNAGQPVDMIIDIEADELAMDVLHDPRVTVVDVRKENEFAEGHVKDALHLPLHEMTDVAQIAGLDDNQNLYLHCAGGYRSVIAASLIKRQGIHNVRNVLGGWGKIKNEKRIVTEKERSILN